MRGLGLSMGFDASRKNGWYLRITQADGSRPKQYFPSAKERDKAAREEVGKIRQGGVVASETVNTADRKAQEEMAREASAAGLTPIEIFRRGLAQVNGGISITKLSAAEAARLFFAEQEQRLADGKISAVRLKEVRNIMNRFLHAHGKRRLALVNRTVIKAYLVGLKVGPQTRVNNARVLSFFMGWCVDEGMLFKNPVPEQEGVQRIPATFTNAQVDELFECAREHHPEIVPMLGLQWYAGLRPGATHHIRWEDVDFTGRRILIQPHGNKLRQPDIVQDLPLTVFALLLPFRESGGLVAYSNHSKLVKALHTRLGFSKAKRRWPEDVARHTFASNLMPFYDLDMKRVEAVMLHATSAMLRKHYLLKNVPRASAQAYFARHLPSA